LAIFVFAPTTATKTIVSSDITGVNFSPTQTNVHTPTAFPVAGTYSTPQSVTLLNVDAALSGFAMYYTIDGTTPTTASTLYVSPILVAVTTIVKAIAIASGIVASAVLTSTYTIGGGSGGGILLLE